MYRKIGNGKISAESASEQREKMRLLEKTTYAGSPNKNSWLGFFRVVVSIIITMV